MTQSTWSEWSCDSRPGAKKIPCSGCGKPFVLDHKKGWKATRVIVREMKVNWFRGDDEVEFYHPECVPHTAPPEFIERDYKYER